MKKLICLLLALLLSCAALAEEPVAMRIVSCPEQGFSTLCKPEYTYDYHPDAGLTITLDNNASVTLFKTDAPGAGFDADYYFNNIYLSLLESTYGTDLLSPGDYTTYTLSGRELPGRMSLYRDGGDTWMRFCVMDLREDCFVRYEAFCPGVTSIMEATLTAVSVAVGNFQPDANYYAQSGGEAPAPTEPVKSSPFDYTDDVLEDGCPIYYFEDLSLTLPADWRGRVMALQGENGVSFYQTASYEKYLAEGIEGGGFLFSLGASVNHSFTELPEFEYIGFSERSAMNYFLELPTDYPAYMQDDIRAEYDAMHAEIDFVAAHANIYPPLDEPSGTFTIPCPELGFSTQADPAYSWDYQEGTGITIYTEEAGRIPYIIVWQSEDLLGEPFDYIKEQFTPYMREKYADKMISFDEYEVYETGGKALPAGLYAYQVEDQTVEMLRLYDSTGNRTVAYTAKYIRGQGDATLKALDTAIRGFKAE